MADASSGVSSVNKYVYVCCVATNEIASTPTTTPSTTTTSESRRASEREPQKSRACLRIERTTSFTGFALRLHAHAPEVVERLDELGSNVGNELELDFSLFDGDHRSVDVVARAGGKRLHGVLGRDAL